MPDNKVKKIFIFILAITAVFGMANFVSAQSGDLAGLNQISGLGLGSEDPRVIAAKIIRVALGFLGIIALVLILYAGWVWMSSEGSEERITKAKNILKSATIGLLIILSAFSLVSILLNSFLGGSGGGSESDGTNSGYTGSIGALGNGVVRSVYPEPNQSDVPRNTSIIVTFRENMDSSSICQTSGAMCNGENIVAENVRLFQTSLRDSCNDLITPCSSNVTDVRAYTNDNQTFIFSPASYIGSPSDNIWYSVILGTGIKKADGSGAFQAFANGYEWRFEVSSRLDLTPPQVVSGGVFPAPDNLRDTPGATVPAAAARGQIRVDSLPAVFTSRSVSPPAGTGDSPSATIQGTYNCQGDGTVNVSISPALTVTAGGVPGFTSGDSVSGDNTAALGCGLSLALNAGSFTAGNSWTFSVTQQKSADMLTVGSVNYTFVSSITGANQILRGATAGACAANIASALSGNGDVTATASGNLVTLTARVAGANGNNISISTTNTGALAITAMSGGVNVQTSSVVGGLKDKPMNAVIQINFNEAVNPMNVSGRSADLADSIRVVNMTSGAPVDGRFVTSNQYKTVEFISDTECGVNACGERIYCLPADSQIRVELMAATLFPCSGGNDCATKNPFNACSGGVCQNTAVTPALNFPGASQPSDGITDISFNSLDGNRDGNAEGRTAFYNQNAPSAAGDSFQWSFFVSGQMDLTPPVITLTMPANSAGGIDLIEPVKVMFDKVMMSSRFITGSTVMNNGQTDVVHQLANLRNFTNQPVGYWTTTESVDIAPADGEPESTNGYINHTDLSDTTSYRAQVGSGVRDIYQNCFKPSAGPACNGSVNSANPSCCSGTASPNETCP